MTEISTATSTTNRNEKPVGSAVNPAFARLGHLISTRFFDKDAFAAHFSMTEVQADSFWEVQRFTTIDRTLVYFMDQLGMDLGVNPNEELTDEQAGRIWYSACTKAPDFYLKVVRPWFLSLGMQLRMAAKAARAEADFVNTHGLFVLAFFNEGRPLFVKAGEELKLVEDRAEATCFPVGTRAELDSIDTNRFSYLESVLKSEYNAVSLKVFAGSK